MEDRTTDSVIVSNVDYSLKNELDNSLRSRLDGQQADMFFKRLLGARRYVDELFRREFDLPAHPYLDILLITRNANGNLNIEHVCESLSLSVNMANRHLAIMLAMRLLERTGPSYRLSRISEEILIDIVQNNLSNLFSLID
ncbi:MAG: hypothetical protein Pars2KO_14740 [Parasphingorhabdus sp.]